MNRNRIALVLLVLAVLAGAAWYSSRPDPVEVVLVTIDRGRVESSVANTRAGTVEACQRARMSTATGGQISRLPVREGDMVSRGDILLELWNDDLAAQMLLAERETGSASARVEEACTLADLAEEDADRIVSLRKKGVASVESRNRAVAEGKARRASCEAARAAAQVAAARVSVSRATLDRTRLRAPFDGVVAEINGEIGEFVTPSPVGVATLPTVDLIDLGCLYVKAPIDEVDAGGVKRDMSARITLDAFADHAFTGRVRRVANYVLDLEKQARTVDIEVEFTGDQGDRVLLPGYSADVEIVLASREDVLRVPTEALLEGNKLLVYTDGTLEEREIETGIANWRFTEITSGIDEGTSIVTSIDREGVEDGARAQPADGDDA